jgi:hypothetical protein
MEAQLHQAQQRLRKLKQDIDALLECLEGILSSTQYQYAENKLYRGYDAALQAYNDTVESENSSE